MLYKRNPQLNKNGELVHLLSTEGLPRDILTHFECRYNGRSVFSATLYPAVAANPYVAFSLKVDDSGTLEFSWEGDHGFRQTETVALRVA